MPTFEQRRYLYTIATPIFVVWSFHRLVYRPRRFREAVAVPRLEDARHARWLPRYSHVTAKRRLLLRCVLVRLSLDV